MFVHLADARVATVVFDLVAAKLRYRYVRIRHVFVPSHFLYRLILSLRLAACLFCLLCLPSYFPLFDFSQLLLDRVCAYLFNS